ncbi:MAG: catalase HPII [Confluentimicrobium sp.]|uniref:catalase n=1 Tax=Actibacterium sp. TaxID=1872125 RepID=UPI000C4BCF22|nr:catalase [Actibacterium sp.]MBC57604.1 catalase HPII [Actibacterium sp.]
MSPKKTSPEITMTQGAGGEPQQRGGETLTTNHGVPIPDNQNSLKSGKRGPTLLEDFVLREKIFHFDHERIPERIVHARGTGAHGYFECTDPIPELTMAQPFQEKGTKVPVFARFSTVAGSKGSKDTPRDVRGFAVKFYTEEGNWDLVGNNIPVFFIQDAMKFPDLIHSVKPEADRGFPQAASAHDTFWDFISLTPESMNMVMWVMSDRAIPRSFRMMDGFGVHTFRFINADGAAKFVKFHWRSTLRAQSTTWDEAVKISGADPDYQRRDMFEAIQSGDFPEWELGVQVFDEDWAAQQPYDVLDATKLIPEEDIPLRIVGRMVLDRYPDNFFAETEQVAFLPTNVIPGIDFSEDPLLQGRLFSYLDTQKSRLGTTNFHQIPVNAPKCPMHNFQRDGMMQTHVHKGRANYEPNSLYKADEETGPRPAEHTFTTHPDAEAGPKLRVRSESFADHYSQARQFYLSQTKPEQDHIVAAITFELSKVDLEHVREQVLAQLRNIDEDMAARIAKGLNIALPKAAEPAREPVEMPVSDALSIHKTAATAPKGRMIGVLVTDGTEDAQVDEIMAAADKAGVTVKIIAEARGGVTLQSGEKLAADGQLAGSPSVLFDAVAVLAAPDAADHLATLAPAKDFVADAFAHLKAMVVTEAATKLLEAVDIKPDEFIFDAGTALTAVVEHAHERLWAREAMVNPAP